MGRGRALGITTVAGLLTAGTACSLRDTPDWHDQLVADSPCYRVDLLDGLDENGTTEIRELYSCVNLHGHVASLGPSVDALEETSREGDPAGVEVARAVNALGRAEVDVFGLAGVLLGLLQADEDPFRRLLDVSIEVTYAERADRVRASVDLTDPDALEAGVLAPLAPVLPVVADALLDDDLDAATWAGDLIAHDDTKRWVLALADLAGSQRNDVGPHARRLLVGAGRSMVEARSPANDRWAEASGDSLRDVAVSLVLGTKGQPPVLDAIAPEAAEILGDATVREELPQALADLWDDGTLERTPDQIVWLASVDADGGSLDGDEASALAAMIRLLHATNRPMECSLDVGITVLSVDLGNLAVSILDTLADMDPNAVQDGADVLGEVLSWGLTDALLQGFANSGVCTALTPQVVDDLGALDVMAGPEAHDVLVLFVRVLNVLKYGDDTRIPPLVDLASDLHALDAVAPLEELVRDAGDADLVDDVLALVPVLVDPDRYGVTAGDEGAPDLEEALGSARWLFDGSPSGWERARPLAQALVRHDGTWEAVGATGRLLADEGSETAALLDLLPPLVEADPDLGVLDQAGALLADRDVAAPLLRAVETDGVVDAVLATRPQGDDPEVPLAFGARLVVGGALEDLLAIVDTLIGSL